MSNHLPYQLEIYVDLDADELETLIREINEDVRSGCKSGYPVRDGDDGEEEQVAYWRL